MAAEAVKEPIRGRKQEKTKRKVRRVDSRGQMGLFRRGLGENREAKKVSASRDLPEFIDPHPEGILIGNQTLGEFLKGTGEKEAFAIRDCLEEMDWREFEAKSKRGGRRPYRPRAMMGLILFGSLQGRTSLRELETLARTDLRAMWITGGICPDHTVIGRFVNRHGSLISEVFFLALSAEVVKRTASQIGRGAVDGTVVQAAASRLSAIKAEAAAEAAREARQQAQAQPGDPRLKQRADQAERVAQTAQQRIAVRKAYRKKKPEAVRVSTTEPEAVNQPLKNGVKAPAYKPSIMANADRIIVAQSVDASSEQKVVGELLEQARKLNGGPLEEVMADSSYFSSSVIETVKEAQVGRFLAPEGRSLGEGPWEKRFSTFPKTQFVYDAEQDSYQCPGGHRLVLIIRGTERGKPYRLYGRAPCAQCPLRPQCTKARDGRNVKRYCDDDIKDQMRATMRQPEARFAYSKRKGMVEPVFSFLKQRQGLTRFRRRGLQKVRVEFALHAAAYNLGRLVAISLRAAGGSDLSHHPGLFEILTLLWRLFLSKTEYSDARSEKQLAILCCDVPLAA